MKPKACHTGMKQGAKVIAFFRNGTRAIGKYLGQTSTAIRIEGYGPIAKASLRALTYYRATDPAAHTPNDNKRGRT